MRNSHAIREADQKPMDNSLLQKHRYALKAEGCANHEPMRGENFQPDGTVRIGDNRGGGRIQVTGKSARLVISQLFSGQI